MAVKTDVRTGHDIAYVTRGHASGCAGAIGYYTRTGEPPGTWEGRGGAALGLSGTVEPSTWWRVWQKVRAVSLTPEQLASPLMKRPYDLRHSGVTWRLNSGVPATEVAAWAGHSVEMLMRVYARCVAGLEGVWIGRMDQALHLGEEP